MTVRMIVTVSMLALVPILQAVAQEGPTEAWSLDGFNAPESVVHDAERGELYVSNVAGAPDEKNRAGFVSRVSPDGEMLEAE